MFLLKDPLHKRPELISMGTYGVTV